MFHPLFLLFCPYAYRYRTMHWDLGSLPADVCPKENGSPSVNNHQLAIYPSGIDNASQFLSWNMTWLSGHLV